MGSSKTGKTYSYPTSPADVGGLRQNLIGNLQSNVGTESPFYGDMSSMIENLLKKRTEPEPYITDKIRSLVQGGEPFRAESYDELSNILMPKYQSDLDEAIAQAKESAGMLGGLRSSEGDYYIGKAAGDTTLDFSSKVLEAALAADTEAKNRELAGLSAYFTEEKLPVEIATILTSAATAAEEGRYPLLPEAIAMATAGMGQASMGTTWQPNFSGGCCFIMNENGDLTQKVREIRDQLFPPNCYIAKGYKRMAKWLVPLMRRSKLVKSLVKLFMTRPIANFCQSNNPLLIPLCVFWAITWELYGRI